MSQLTSCSCQLVDMKSTNTGEIQVKLLDQVRAHISENPGDYPAFRAAIDEGFKQYVEFLKNQRDMQAFSAVHSLVCFAKPPTALGVGWYLDIVWFQFPKGTAGQSPGAIKFWNQFIKAAKKEYPEGIDKTWVIQTRGTDCLDWWNKYVKPELEQTNNV